MNRFWFAALVLLTLAVHGRATDYSWTNVLGGNYGTGTNWNGGVVPTGTDNGLIDLGGTYTVTLDGATTPYVLSHELAYDVDLRRLLPIDAP